MLGFPRVIAGVRMPYVNGVWQNEDSSVSGRVAAITAQDSDLMKQARTAGMQSANRRGMLNSSMGIGAGISATLNAATPIASQEAQQANQNNLAAAEDRRTRDLAGMEDTRVRDLATMEDARTRTLAGNEDTRIRDLATMDNARMREATGIEDARVRAIASSEDARVRALASMEDSRARDLSFADNSRIRDIAGMDDARMRALAEAENQRVRDLATMDDARTRALATAEDQRARDLARDNIAANDRGNYTQQLIQAGNVYNTGVANTLQNDKIPAATRSAVQADMAAQFRAQQEQLARIYGVQLNWGP